FVKKFPSDEYLRLRARSRVYFAHILSLRLSENCNGFREGSLPMLRVGKQLFRPGSDVMLAVLLFVATLSIFLVSRVHQVTDSSYSMLLSESLIHRHS